jgi:hypothetical protein
VKAYRVSCDDDDHGCVIRFADRSKDVSRYANSEICDCPWIERRVKREPEFDDLSPGPVTIAQYLAKGWWWECHCCGRLCYEDTNPAIVNERVFCNDDCVIAYVASYEDCERMGDCLKRCLETLQTYLDSREVTSDP